MNDASTMDGIVKNLPGKVVQFQITDLSGVQQITVLCDDGTIWQKRVSGNMIDAANTKWFRIYT